MGEISTSSFSRQLTCKYQLLGQCSAPFQTESVAGTLLQRASSGTHFQGHRAEQDPLGGTTSVKLNEHDPLRKEMPSFKQVACKPSGPGRYPPEPSFQPAVIIEPLGSRSPLETLLAFPQVAWEGGVCWSLQSEAVVLWMGAESSPQEKILCASSQHRRSSSLCQWLKASHGGIMDSRETGRCRQVPLRALFSASRL